MDVSTPLPPLDNRRSTIRENFYDFLMNSQNILSLFKTNIPKLTFENDHIYILGKKYSLTIGLDPKNINKSIETKFLQIIWFSYRRNFPILKPKIDKTYISDTGWGCSIRVGQMIFAETLTRHLFDGNRCDKIIGFFNDCEIDPYKSPFSIQQITIACAEIFNLNPGSWFKFTHVFMLFENLYHNFARELIPNLEFLLFSDGILFFNQKATYYLACFECLKKKHQTFFRDKLCDNCKKFDKSLFLLICMMPALNHLREDDFAFIDELMSVPYFVGLMGGKPGRAKYFVAARSGYLICKDPHYVQDAVEGQKDCSSYFTKEIKYVDIKKMASSLAFGFYFNNEKEFEHFEIFIRKKKFEMGDKWLVSFEEEFREIDFKEEMKIDEYEEEKNDGFEVVEDNSLVIIEKNEKEKEINKINDN